MMKAFLLTLPVLLGVSNSMYGQYLETFDVDNKGYKQNLANDLSGINWTLSPWETSNANRDVDDYAETGPVTSTISPNLPDNVFGSVDLDQELCWTSPKLIVKSNGTFNFTADHTWNGFDPLQTIPLEYMNTEYQINGGAWVRHPNIIGGFGDPAYTVRYIAGTGGQNGTGTTSFTNVSVLFQNTVYVRVCWSDNANAELTTLDNVSVTNVQTQPTFTTALTQTCTGSSNGSITVTATAGMGGSSTFTYSNNNGTSYQSSNVFNNLAAGSYTILVKDGNNIVSEPVTVNVTSNGQTPPTVTCPANSTVNLTDPAFALTGGSPSGGTYTGPGVSSGQFNPSTAGVGTHTITYTYSNGSCSSSCTFTISVQSGPTVTCPANSSVCINAPAFTLTGGSPAGGTYSGPGVSGGQFNPATAGAGAKTINYTVSGTSCAFTITVNALPTASISVSETSGVANNDGIICSGATAVLTASGGGTYLWSTTGTTASINVTTAGTYTVTVTNGNGCTATATTTITVNPLPTASIGVVDNSGNVNNDGIICTGATATLTATGGGTYLWSTTATTASINATTAGTYTVTVTNGNGCTATATATITVNPLPTASINVSETSGTINNDGIICTGATAILTATGGGSYLWSTTATTASINVTTAGTYTVTVTNANGCTATSTTTITVNPLPTASISVADNSGNVNNDGIICTGATATLTATGGGTYLWSTTATTASINVTTAGTYTVTVTNGNGCTATSSTTVSVNALPLAAINVSENSGTANDGAICTGSAATLTASGGGSYIWSTAATTAAITVSPANTSAYTVTVTNAAGCSATTATQITVNSVSAAVTVSETSGTANNDGIICRNAPVTLNVTGAGTYLWSQGSSTSSIVVSPASTTTFTVTVTGAGGCTAVASTTITVNPLPTPSIVPVFANVCTGSSITITATGGVAYNWNNGSSTAQISVSPNITTIYTVTVTNANACSAVYSDTVNVRQLPTITPSITNVTNCTVNNGAISLAIGGQSGPYSFAWATTNGSGLNPTAQNQTGLSAGTYNVTVTAYYGCTATGSFTVQQPTTPTATIATEDFSGLAQNDGIVCANDLFILNAGGGNSYLWNAVPLPGQSPNNFQIYGLAATNATYTVTVTDGNGCTATASASITVLPAANAAISISETSGVANNDGILCAGATATLTAQGTGIYQWNTGATTASINTSTAGSFNLMIVDANGCAASSTVSVSVNPLPTPAITVNETSGIANNDGVLCTGDMATLTATGGAGAYLWNTGATTASITTSTGGTYTVTFTNTNGCSGTASTTLTYNTPPVASVNISESSGVASNDGIICIGDPVTLTASGGTGYLWPNMATTASITVTPSASTNYVVTVTNANGCASTASGAITANQCTVNISGNIKWENNNAPVKDVNLFLQSLPGLATLNSYLTTANGDYTFMVTPGGDYRVKPTKNINLLNGVDAADATRIQQHISGNLLTGPYKRIAADVNKSNSITSYDATLITQALVNNPAALLVFNTSWRFVPEAYSFPTPTAPWSFPEKLDFSAVSSNQTGQNFIGVKIGDVNGSGNAQQKPGQPVVWVVNDAVLEQGKTVTATFTANNFEDVAAFQMGLSFDADQLAFNHFKSEGALEMTDDNFGAFDTKDGQLRTVWATDLGRTLESGRPVFSAQFTALESGRKLSEVLHIDESILHCAAYNTVLNPSGIELAFNDAQVSGTSSPESNGLSLLQNRPNPFTGRTTIGFILPQSCHAQLRIVDISGRIIAESNNTYAAGYQQESFDLSGQNGTLFYELTTPYGTAVRKMIATQQ